MSCGCESCVCGANEVVGNTHLVLVVDESSSMAVCWDGTISGFNEYINTLKASEGSENTLVTLVKFSDKSNIVYSGIRLTGVPELTKKTYSPSGMTALNDAIYDAISTVEKAMDRNDRALVVSITDGGENQSRRKTTSQIKSLVDAKQESGNWTFVFLQANLDAFSVGANYGFYAGNTANYTSSNVGTRSAFSSVGASSIAYMATPASAVEDFFDGETEIEESEEIKTNRNKIFGNNN